MPSSLQSPESDELAAMAYVDGELAPEARRQFEERLRREPRLAREVAAQRRLAVLARNAAGPEPAELEWERIAAHPAHRIAHLLGWGLAAAGGLGLVLVGFFLILRSPLPIALKLVAVALGGGFVLVFGTTLRGRLLTRHLDPYRDLKR